MAVSVEREGQRAGGKPREAAKAPAERGKRGIFGDSLEGVEDVLVGLQG